MEPKVPTFTKKITNLPPLAPLETEKLTAPVKVPVFKKTSAPVSESLYDKLLEFSTALRSEKRIKSATLDDIESSIRGAKDDYDSGNDTKDEYVEALEVSKLQLIGKAKDAERRDLIPAEFKSGGRKKTKRSKRSRRKTKKRTY